MKSDDLSDCEFVAPSLHYGARPALQPAAWRTFPFDLETCPAVSQQHEAGSSGDKMRTSAAHDFPRLCVECLVDEFLQHFAAAYDRTEACCSEQVVPDAMSS